MERDCILYKIRRKIQTLASKILPTELLSKIYFWIVLRKKAHISNPQTFNEKLQWLKLHYYPNNPLVVKCADKYTVREYIKDKGLEHLLTPLLGVWNKAEQIDWFNLPENFVLKCNHGCAYNILCADKTKLNIDDTSKQLNSWLKEDFGSFNLELHYSQIKYHKIICEVYLGDCITDYKFFCFNGKPKLMYVSKDLVHDRQAQIGFFNLDGSKYPLIRDDYDNIETIELPSFYQEMLHDAEVLCKDFPFVRVDFFITDNRYYFAELTFTPAACMMPFNPSVFDMIWGSYISIEQLLNNER